MPKDWSKYKVDFFGFDSDFLRDVKIKRLRRQYGCNGVVIYLATVCKMYETTGYYAVLDENFFYDIADDVEGKYAPTEDVVRAVIEFCIGQGLLSRHASGEIITAHRVQVQFYLATKRRKNIEVNRELWLLSNEEMEQLGADSPVYRFLNNVDILPKNVDIFPESADILPQSKSKKENITTTTTTHSHERVCAQEEPAQEPPSESQVYAYFRNEHGIDHASQEAQAFCARNALYGWKCLPDWQKAADLWVARKNQRDAERDD